eukprot:TRINITY_DN4125_c0_g1_i1.p1 TRINITY_DN4125_c0_g1~~TRINITY_DN4125_c0_g1_i1.p1  ORF type:complete len:132 (+),score=25.32 TRINITY_DN4125_c0_g1_i1:31-396(+)
MDDEKVSSLQIMAEKSFFVCKKTQSFPGFLANKARDILSLFAQSDAKLKAFAAFQSYILEMDCHSCSKILSKFIGDDDKLYVLKTLKHLINNLGNDKEVSKLVYMFISPKAQAQARLILKS